MAPRKISMNVQMINVSKLATAVECSPLFRTLESLLLYSALELRPSIPDDIAVKLIDTLGRLPRLHTLSLPEWRHVPERKDAFTALHTLQIEEVVACSCPSHFPVSLTHLHISRVRGPEEYVEVWPLRLLKNTTLKKLTLNPFSWGWTQGLAMFGNITPLLEACTQLEELRVASRLFNDESTTSDATDAKFEENAHTHAILSKHPSLRHLDVVCACGQPSPACIWMTEALRDMQHLVSLSVSCIAQDEDREGEPCTRMLRSLPSGVLKRLVAYEANASNLMGTQSLGITGLELPELTSLYVPAVLLCATEIDASWAPKLHTLVLKGDSQIPKAHRDRFYRAMAPHLKHFTVRPDYPNSGRSGPCSLPLACTELETYNDFRTALSHDDDAKLGDGFAIHAFKKLQKLTVTIAFLSHPRPHDYHPPWKPDHVRLAEAWECKCVSTIEERLARGWLSRENLPHLHTLNIICEARAVATLRKEQIPPKWRELTEKWRAVYFRHITYFNVITDVLQTDLLL
jgi:hypothetical protein